MSSTSGFSSADLDAVIAEFLEAEEAGEPIAPDELLARHPEFAEPLREFLADRDALRSAARPLAEAVMSRRPVADNIRYFGDYELLEEIARGGMGVVYKARQTSLNRMVAVKMILAGSLASEVDVQRFQTEAQAAARLQHPNIVSVHEVGRHQGQSYFSMDFVEGRNLAEIARDNPLPARRAAEYVAQIADAVQYAHEQGTLHRDLKPSNVLIDKDNRIRITDFGLALTADADTQLTKTGQALGTPAYMPPEQAQGKRGLIGPASDIYSLGAILYELVTGRPPFRGESPVETMRQSIESEPLSPRLLNPAVPRDVETICLKSLEKEPHRRFASARHLADDLRRFLNGEPIHARPLGRAARVWRWCRRKPLAAALSIALLLAIVSTLIVLFVANVLINTALDDRTDALARARIDKQAAENSLAAEKRAVAIQNRLNEQLESTLERTQWNAYRLGILLSAKEGEAGNTRAALARLAACRPARLRGFEWHFQVSRFRSPLIAEWTHRMRRPPRPASSTGRAIAEIDGKLHVYDPAQDRVVKQLPVPPHEYAHSISPDGAWVAFIPRRSIRRTIRIHSLAGEQPRPTITLPPGDFVHDVVFSSRGERLLALIEPTAGKPNLAAQRASVRASVIKVWNTATGTIAATYRIAGLPGRRESQYRNPIAADESLHRLLLPTKLVDLATSRTLLKFSEPAEALALNRGATLAAVATRSGKLSVWDTQSGQLVDEWSTMRRVGQLAFRPHAREIAVGCVDGTIEFRDFDRRRSATPLPSGPAVRELVFLPDGMRLLTVHAAVRGATSYRVWNSNWNACLVVAVPQLGKSPWGRQMCFSPDARQIAIVGRNGTIHLLDAGNGRPVRDFRARVRTRNHLASVAFSSDGQTIAAAGRDGFFVWNVKTGRLERRLRPDVGTFCTQAAFSPDGLLLAGAHQDGLTVWNWKTGGVQKAVRSRGCEFRSVGYSSDGEFLYATANRGRSRIWNVADWSVRCRLTDSRSDRAVLSPDNKLLAIPATNEIQLVDTSTGEMQRALKFSHSTGEVCFSPDGKRIVALAGNRARLFDTKSGEQLLTLTGHLRPIKAVAFSPAGDRIATATDDGTLRVWGEPSPAK